MFANQADILVKSLHLGHPVVGVQHGVVGATYSVASACFAGQVSAGAATADQDQAPG